MIVDIYDNGSFKVVLNNYENSYYIVNNNTGIKESTESHETVAITKADALKSVRDKIYEGVD